LSSKVSLAGWTPDTASAGPYQDLRRERAAAMGVAAVMLTILTTLNLTGAAPALAYAAILGLAFAPCMGVAWTRYEIGVICAAIRGRLPIRLETFMTWACDSGMLRMTGSAYQFRHRELQTWLIHCASRPPSETG
jgi:hypothetical protein